VVNAVTSPRILVFLGAYQGAPFIAEQIGSILKQSVSCDLVISDDGSRDGSREYVQEIASMSSSITLLEGPRQGYCNNFLSMFQLSDIDRYDYVAWSDQDDLWEPHHLARAIASLRSCRTPAAFGSRTRLINSFGLTIGYSPVWKKPLCFQNALVQSVAGGNTLVMNRQCVQWIQQCMARENINSEQWVSHDWAVYLMLSLAGFPLIWDAVPTVYYRQHATNVIGSNRGLFARIERVMRLQKGVFARWMQLHFLSLQQLTDAMLPVSRDALHNLMDATSTRGVASFRAIERSGVYRQGFLDQRALEYAALLGLLMPKSAVTD